MTTSLFLNSSSKIDKTDSSHEYLGWVKQCASATFNISYRSSLAASFAGLSQE